MYLNTVINSFYDCFIFYQTNRGSILNNNQFREAVQDSCTPIPLSSESTLIIRDNRFRYEDIKVF